MGSNLDNRIVIVGAGPAGSSLAIRLAQKGCHVTLIEKDRFPREKLCGEFISPECLRHF
jgi:flavin-dependent dehydrogenase